MTDLTADDTALLRQALDVLFEDAQERDPDEAEALTDRIDAVQRKLDAIDKTVHIGDLTLQAPPEWHDRIRALGGLATGPTLDLGVRSHLSAMSDSVGFGFTSAAYDRLLSAERRAEHVRRLGLIDEGEHA